MVFFTYIPVETTNFVLANKCLNYVVSNFDKLSNGDMKDINDVLRLFLAISDPAENVGNEHVFHAGFFKHSVFCHVDNDTNILTVFNGACDNNVGISYQLKDKKTLDYFVREFKRINQNHLNYVAYHNNIQSLRKNAETFCAFQFPKQNIGNCHHYSMYAFVFWKLMGNKNLEDFRKEIEKNILGNTKLLFDSLDVSISGKNAIGMFNQTLEECNKKQSKFFEKQHKDSDIISCIYPYYDNKKNISSEQLKKEILFVVSMGSDNFEKYIYDNYSFQIKGSGKIKGAKLLGVPLQELNIDGVKDLKDLRKLLESTYITSKPTSKPLVAPEKKQRSEQQAKQ